MEAQLQNALMRHENVRRSTDIPPFFGVKGKDTVLPHVLLQRVEAAAEVANWDDARKCRELYLILREKALEWYESLRHLQVDTRNWGALQREFLAAFEPKHTARTTCTNFQELIQRNGENVQDYFSRVATVFTRLCDARPVNMADVRRVYVPPNHPPLAPDANAAAQAAHAALPVMPLNEGRRADKMEGIRDNERFFLHQLFVAGLKDEIRAEVMRAGNIDLGLSLSTAREFEVILMDKKKTSAHIHPVQQEKVNPEEDEDEDEEEEETIDLTEEEVETVNLIRKHRGKPPFRKFGKSNFRRFEGKCKYCNKTGHKQLQCHKRIKEGAPLIPFKKIQMIEQSETEPQEIEEQEVNIIQHQINTLNW
jgi:hypothetical protein